MHASEARFARPRLDSVLALLARVARYESMVFEDDRSDTNSATFSRITPTPFPRDETVSKSPSNAP